MDDEYDDFFEVSYEGEEIDLGDLALSPFAKLVDLVTGDDEEAVTATEPDMDTNDDLAPGQRPSSAEWLTLSSAEAPASARLGSPHGEPSGDDLAPSSDRTDVEAEVDSWLADEPTGSQARGMSMPEWLTDEPPADETPEEKEARERTEEAKMSALQQEHSNIETSLRNIHA